MNTRHPVAGRNRRAEPSEDAGDSKSNNRSGNSPGERAEAGLFGQFAANMPEAVWIRDAGSKVLHYVNPAWEKITGLVVRVDDSMDRLFEAFHPEDLQRALDAARAFPNGGANLECRVVLPDGGTRWVRVRTFPIVDAHGKVDRVGGLMDDVTERTEERDRAEKLKDEFVATVSHELRTPLTSIAGSLGLLVGNAAGKLPESAVRLLAIAHNNSQRLVRLISDLLDIEKIESGKVVFALDRVELKPLIMRSIEDIRGLAQSFSVRVRLDSAAPSADVCADSDRLVQVFTNLLSNAVKFSPVHSEVFVAVEKRHGTVVASVRDHGPGIPDEFKPRIFEKFAQADSIEARQMGGTGLGLSIVHQIVTRLGGKVGFADAPGGGTIFHVELPEWTYANEKHSALDGKPDRPRLV